MALNIFEDIVKPPNIFSETAGKNIFQDLVEPSEAISTKVIPEIRAVTPEMKLRAPTQKEQIKLQQSWEKRRGITRDVLGEFASAHPLFPVFATIMPAFEAAYLALSKLPKISQTKIGKRILSTLPEEETLEAPELIGGKSVYRPREGMATYMDALQNLTTYLASGKIENAVSQKIVANSVKVLGGKMMDAGYGTVVLDIPQETIDKVGKYTPSGEALLTNLKVRKFKVPARPPALAGIEPPPVEPGITPETTPSVIPSVIPLPDQETLTKHKAFIDSVSKGITEAALESKEFTESLRDIGAEKIPDIWEKNFASQRKIHLKKITDLEALKSKAQSGDEIDIIQRKISTAQKSLEAVESNYLKDIQKENPHLLDKARGFIESKKQEEMAAAELAQLDAMQADIDVYIEKGIEIGKPRIPHKKIEELQALARQYAAKYAPKTEVPAVEEVVTPEKKIKFSPEKERLLKLIEETEGPQGTYLEGLSEEELRQELASRGAEEKVVSPKERESKFQTGQVVRDIKNDVGIIQDIEYDKEAKTYIYDVAFAGQEGVAKLSEDLLTPNAGVSKPKVKPEEGDYEPSHPFYYKDNKPLSVKEIEPVIFTDESIYSDIQKIIKDPNKLMVKSMQIQQELARDIDRYTDLVKKGTKALSKYDIEIASGGDAEGALRTALSLVHNHISSEKGQINYISQKLGKEPVFEAKKKIPPESPFAKEVERVKGREPKITRKEVEKEIKDSPMIFKPSKLIETPTGFIGVQKKEIIPAKVISNIIKFQKAKQLPQNERKREETILQFAGLKKEDITYPLIEHDIHFYPEFFVSGKKPMGLNTGIIGKNTYFAGYGGGQRDQYYYVYEKLPNGDIQRTHVALYQNDYYDGDAEKAIAIGLGKRLAEKELSEPEQYADTYQTQIFKDYQKKFGIKVHVDEFMKYLKPVGYKGIPSEEFRKAAGKLAREYFDKLIEQNKDTGKDVILVGGWQGSGKTTVINKMKEEGRAAIFEVTLRETERAEEIVQEILDAGLKPAPTLIVRDPYDAYINGVIARALNPKSTDYGRVVPVDYFMHFLKNATPTFNHLIEKFGEEIDYLIVDNRKLGKKLETLSLDELNKIEYNYDKEEKEIRNELKRSKDIPAEIKERSLASGDAGRFEQPLTERPEVGTVSPPTRPEVLAKTKPLTAVEKLQARAREIQAKAPPPKIKGAPRARAGVGKPKSDLDVVALNVPRKPGLPILSNIHIKGNLIYATDMDSAIVYKVDKPIGNISIPAENLKGKFLSEIKTVPGKPNTIQIGNVQAIGTNIADAPELPKVENVQLSTSINTQPISDILTRISPFISEDETRHVLTGAYLHFSPAGLEVEATDGRRLIHESLPIKTTKDIKVILPLESIKKLLKVLNAANPATIKFEIFGKKGSPQVSIAAGNYQFMSRTIEAEWPDTKTVIKDASSYKTYFVVNTQDLYNLVKGIPRNLITADYQAAELTIEPDILILKKSMEGVGEYKQSIAINKLTAQPPETKSPQQIVLPMKLFDAKGNDIKIGNAFGMNPDFILDAMASSPTGQVIIGYDNPEKPITVTYRGPQQPMAGGMMHLAEIPKPELELRKMTTDELETYIDSRYEIGVPQSELDKLETIYDERISEEEQAITEEELGISEETYQGAGLEEQLINMYHRYLHPKLRSGMEEKDILANMRSAIETYGAKKQLSDEQILSAAKDIYKKKQDLIRRYKAKKGIEEKIIGRGDIYRITEDTEVTNTNGQKVILPKGEEYTVYELENNKYRLQDGKQVTVYEGELDKIKGEILGEGNVAAGGMIHLTDDEKRINKLKSILRKKTRQDLLNEVGRRMQEKSLYPAHFRNFMLYYFQTTSPMGLSNKDLRRLIVLMEQRKEELVIPVTQTDQKITQIDEAHRKKYIPVPGMRFVTVLRTKGGDPGKELADRWERFEMRQDQYIGKAIIAAKKMLNLLGGVKNFSDFVAVIEGERAPKNDIEKEALRVYHEEIIDPFAERAINSGLEVRDEGGFLRGFKPRQNYWPRMYNLSELDKAEYKQKAIKYLMDRLKVSEAYATEVFETQRKDLRSAKYGHLERAREVDLPDYRRDSDVLIEYIVRAARRISWVEQFGKDILVGVGKGFAPKKAIELIGQLPYPELRQHARNFLKVIEGVGENDRVLARALGTIRTLQVVKLVFSAIPNFFQHFTNTWPVVGTEAYLKGIWDRLHKEGREFAEVSGSINSQRAIEQAEIKRGGIVGKFAERFLRIIAFSGTEFNNRYITAPAGREYAKRIAQKFMKGGGVSWRSPFYKEELKKMFIDPEELLKRGYLTEQQLQDAAWSINKMTQFLASPGYLPLSWSGQLGKTATQFKKFAYNQSILFFEEGIKPAVDFVASGGRKGTMRKLIYFMIAIPIAGAIVRKIKNLIYRRKVSDADKPLYTKMLLWAMDVGGFGIAADAIFAMSYDEKGIYSFLGGPTLSDVVSTLTALYKTGKYASEQNLEQAKFSLFTGVSGLSPALRVAFNIMEPSLKRLREISTSEKDIEALRGRIIEYMQKGDSRRVQIAQKELLANYGPGSAYHRKFGKYVGPVTGRDVFEYNKRETMPYITQRERMLPGKRNNIFMDLVR